MYDSTDCSPPGSSVRGLLQARILEWVAVAFSRASSSPRDGSQVSHIAGRCFTIRASVDSLTGLDRECFQTCLHSHLGTNECLTAFRPPFMGSPGADGGDEGVAVASRVSELK